MLLRVGDEAPVFAFLQSTQADVDAVVRSVLTGSRAAGETAHSSLGLEGIPGRIAWLAEGLIYGVACHEQAVRLPLLAGALRASLRSGKRCALLTPCDPGMFLRKARLAGLALDGWLKSGALAIFQFAPDADKHLFRAGAERLVTELEQNIAPRDAFLVVDQADALFMLSDPQAAAEAAQRYTDWTASRGHVVLAAFAPAANAPRDYLTLRRIAENFGGFALARPAHRGAALEVRHWFGTEGASSRESFELLWRGSGALTAWAAKSPESDDELPPVDSVIWVSGAIGGGVAASRSWRQAESILDALDAARCSESAILLLPFQRAQDHELLCRSVVAVRAMERASLRVIVRERGLRLRASEALALTRLGTSSIIPADVPDRAAKRIVDLLHGTRFSRPYDTDLHQVQEESTGLLRREVAGASSFCDAVERLLASADDFGIESSLVRLELGAVEPAKLLSLARRGARELLALARGKTLWLFLFGCAASIAPTVLKRLFAAPLDEYCTNFQVLHDPERILAEISTLRDV